MLHHQGDGEDWQIKYGHTSFATLVIETENNSTSFEFCPHDLYDQWKEMVA